MSKDTNSETGGLRTQVHAFWITEKQSKFAHDTMVALNGAHRGEKTQLIRDALIAGLIINSLNPRLMHMINAHADQLTLSQLRDFITGLSGPGNAYDPHASQNSDHLVKEIGARFDSSVEKLIQTLKVELATHSVPISKSEITTDTLSESLTTKTDKHLLEPTGGEHSSVPLMEKKANLAVSDTIDATSPSGLTNKNLQEIPATTSKNRGNQSVKNRIKTFGA
ncbi:hypothetical protein EDF88_4670 [Buttiauxella sp. BIGb0552]|uniref:hypothetical protein n=1 Tax=Buttiauxella sp. BIGb0552 TaxID=2485120 RepID=UPI001066D267|nr:hypothetical protein [Buttiauxella sp. BIGb0552]TDX12072.1 hypothetical protein EDF88_4670 [Buttiauxella sp. BIGb0552]